jgi:hypothetical protein
MGHHIPCHMGYCMECLDTNKKQITEYVNKPRDEFIKPN